jgi:hypothetical protein
MIGDEEFDADEILRDADEKVIDEDEPIHEEIKELNFGGHRRKINFGELGVENFEVG